MQAHSRHGLNAICGGHLLDEISVKEHKACEGK